MQVNRHYAVKKNPMSSQNKFLNLCISSNYAYGVRYYDSVDTITKYPRGLQIDTWVDFGAL